MKKETRVVKATERKSNRTRNERASKVRGNKEYISVSRKVHVSYKPCQTILSIVQEGHDQLVEGQQRFHMRTESLQQLFSDDKRMVSMKHIHSKR